MSFLTLLIQYYRKKLFVHIKKVHICYSKSLRIKLGQLVYLFIFFTNKIIKDLIVQKVNQNQSI